MNKRPRCRLGALWLSATLLAGSAARGVEAASPETPAIDCAAAEFMRGWLGELPLDVSARNETAISPEAAARLDGWRSYRAALEINDPGTREELLRNIHDQTESPELRERILHTIHIDPAFRSRQALFIRRYGYYANWFNRLISTSVRLVQGNLQAVLQLPIDAINDAFRSREADARLRQAYDLMRQAEALRQRPGASDKELASIERRINKSFASLDLEQADWAMRTGDPSAAAFYASQALARRPGWNRAGKLKQRALAEEAAQRRRALASDQVGYPDRTPPFDSEPAELLRPVLAGEAFDLADDEKGLELIATVLRDQPPPETGWAGFMRGWPALIEKYGGNAPPHHVRFLRAMMLDPAFNPDLQLERARATRRGQRFKYVLLGSDSNRERAYKAASGVTQTLNALHNIGILYVFEVLGRGIKIAVSPPTPDDSVLDAQARWLREAPNPENPEARMIARSLAKSYDDRHRYQKARLALVHCGELTGKRLEQIDNDEARRLYLAAKKTPSGPGRDLLIGRIGEIAPSSKWMKKAKALNEKPEKKKKGEKVEFSVAWDAVARWSGRKLPAGLPGRAEWFDHDPVNGEIAQTGPLFTDQDGAMTICYRVLYPDGPRAYEDKVEPGALPARLRNWLVLAGDQRREASATAKRFDRLPVPFEIIGGAGPSGVDLEPRLLPIEAEPGELKLYR